MIVKLRKNNVTNILPRNLYIDGKPVFDTNMSSTGELVLKQKTIAGEPITSTC